MTFMVVGDESRVSGVDWRCDYFVLKGAKCSVDTSQSRSQSGAILYITMIPRSYHLR